MKVVSRDVFISYGRFGMTAWPGFVSYIHREKPILMHRYGLQEGDDVYGTWSDIISYDNGRTWTDPVVFRDSENAAGGRIRYTESGVVFDTDTNKLINVTSGGLYLEDRCSGAQKMELYIEVYDPATGTWGSPYVTDLGIKEGMLIGSLNPIKTSRGRFIFPVFKPLVDQNGKIVYYKGCGSRADVPFAAIGEYQVDGTIRWHAGRAVPYDLEKNSRGLSECAVIELKNGRIAMIMRGDNELFPERPGYKWLTFSENQGETWSDPVPLPCTEGGPIESSGTRSTVFRSIKNGRIYWMGILCILDERPNGNWPRVPFVIGEIQEEPFALKRETITIVDQRTLTDSPQVQLANWTFYQDRETGEVVVFMPRLGERENWMVADYYRYRIGI